jgi:LssY-like putative type I secretion system component LssY
VVWPRPTSTCPIGSPEGSQASRNSFVETFRTDFDDMFNALNIATGDSARPKRHVKVLSRQVFFSVSNSMCWHLMSAWVVPTAKDKAFLCTQMRNWAGKALILGLTVALSGCIIYQPRPAVNLNSLPQARTQTDGQVRITAAVLSAEQSRKVFGVPIYRSRVQPVWLSIENHDRVPYAFLPISVDQNRFSPLEAAYRNHYRLFPLVNDRMNTYFLQNEIGRFVPAGRTISGFVYTNKELGAKFVQVELVGPSGTKPKLLSFLLPVPGLRTHYNAVLVGELYKQDEIKSYDEEGLRQALERLPCCTTNADGTVDGDPLNLVFVGEIDEIFSALLDRQWNMTEELDLGSSWKETKAFLFGTSFRHAPASPLYFYGRRQDVTIQKPRTTIEARNHLRLWRAPMQFEGKPVWVGQVSRDIGVRFTLDTWNLTTHRIDPHVDDTREYLVADLFHSRLVTKVAYVKGSPAATLASPRKNLTGDWYITDGLRAVLVFSRNRVSDSAIQPLDWELLPSSTEFRDQRLGKKSQE